MRQLPVDVVGVDIGFCRGARPADAVLAIGRLLVGEEVVTVSYFGKSNMTSTENSPISTATHIALGEHHSRTLRK